MNTVELSGTAYEPAANSAPITSLGWPTGAVNERRGDPARGFLIQLVVREIQFTARSIGWLGEIADQLRSLDEPGSRAAADECLRLAKQTRALRAELVVLVHRLVARRNRLNPARRLDVIALLAQPLSVAMVELIELHEINVVRSAPWLELAALRPLEQMLAGMVPLAIDIAGVDHDDLCEAAQLFEARKQRARLFGSLLANLLEADPRRCALAAAAEDEALARVTKLLRECAEVGRELDSWRYGFVR